MRDILSKRPDPNAVTNVFHFLLRSVFKLKLFGNTLFFAVAQLVSYAWDSGAFLLRQT